MQFCFMTALLMRWQVIPANFVVFCNWCNYCHPSRSYATDGKNNNNHDNVYGAVIMTIAVHLMNADWAPGGRQLSDQANRLGLRVRRNKGSYRSRFTIAICYYYLARKRILILLSHGRWKAESTCKHCSKAVQPVPKAVYRSGCRDKHKRPRWDSNLGPVIPQSDALATRPPLRPALE